MRVFKNIILPILIGLVVVVFMLLMSEAVLELMYMFTAIVPIILGLCIINALWFLGKVIVETIHHYRTNQKS